MSDLTPERLARLRIWANRQRPVEAVGGADYGRHQYDGACPWCRRDDQQLETIKGFVFEGNAHDLAIELLDEIKDAHASYGGAMADLDALVEVARAAVADGGHARDHTPLGQLARFLARNYPPKETAPETTVVSCGDMAIELPAPKDRVVDLMAALEDSIARAKEARTRHPQPRIEP